MILIADGGSTKVDWVVLNDKGIEVFRTRTQGLNPALLSIEALKERVLADGQLTQIKAQVDTLYFYGAGCGTKEAVLKLEKVFASIFVKAELGVYEDMLAAVYASSGGEESIVCILGTGSNSCYFDGEIAFSNVVSLGYLIMDEASGNYFGKQLVRDYYYNRMPEEIALNFEKKYDLAPTTIKQKLYREESPNAYLGDFASFMFDYTDHEYMHNLLKKGFSEFIEYRILAYEKHQNVPIYFIGSIAYFFEKILRETAYEYHISIAGIIRRPIDNLINYHKKKILG